ncbi:tripartite motif-containing protein 26-like isoform X1 [Eriocheir sinensis]|uniref:tripartite motif-containing protein 26-like isoform X1 n=1 Tax=Eriocheir sinensis TaxID=95602 RepID=UPI0021C5BF07|nr:tripartite motif-containing protein 26-like isoform X1 [Eriocheir sinensis]XP_050733130.1 tripartite motif-containing protein 26-like isoform X1 [Eriocheir sinensis]XP_050733131.1 tripartite motif-containing protein 26-like isoform X1 [Eriocheir sinensis]
MDDEGLNQSLPQTTCPEDHHHHPGLYGTVQGKARWGRYKHLPAWAHHQAQPRETLPNEEEEEEEEEDWEEDEEHRRNPLREQEEEEEEEEEEDTGIPWCRSLVKLSAGSH